jgi:hypothetical protein
VAFVSERASVSCSGKNSSNQVSCSGFQVEKWMKGMEKKIRRKICGYRER